MRGNTCMPCFTFGHEMDTKRKSKVVPTFGEYDESSIIALEGLDGVRAKPAFYLGTPPNGEGLYQLAKELVDNAADEAQNGFGDEVGIAVEGDTLIVWDHGRGIPVGVHPKFKAKGTSTLEVIFSTLHAGGKLYANQTGYKKSRGTHGVGAAVVNALTESLEVFSCRDGQWYTQRFSKGKTISNVIRLKSPPTLPGRQKVPKSGTIVRYRPDMDIFAKKSRLAFEHILSWFELQAYIHPKIKFTTVLNGKSRTFYQKNGLVDFLTKRLEDLKAEATGKAFFHQSEHVDVALQWSSHSDEEVKSYINGSPTSDGGTHVTGLQKAITEVLKAHAGKKDEFKPEDLRFGLLAVLNYSTKSPEFDSQSKSKGVSKEAASEVYNEVVKPLTEFFNKNKALAKEIITRAVEIRKKTSSFLADKKLIQKVKAASKGLSAKLADVSDSKTPFSERELYLVEGDSAGGSAKIARYKTFQATYSLKGKPLNVMEVAKAKVNASQEIAGILASIGMDLNSPDPLSKLRFGKIIFLADADVDGRHINTLLLTLFWKYLPTLFDQGRIFLVKSPEYMCHYKGKLLFGTTKESVIKQAGTSKINIRHLKGWGEVDAVDLQPMAFEIGSRKLYRVMPPTDKKGRQQFEALMGKNPAFRQKLLGLV